MPIRLARLPVAIAAVASAACSSPFFSLKSASASAAVTTFSISGRAWVVKISIASLLWPLLLGARTISFAASQPFRASASAVNSRRSSSATIVPSYVLNRPSSFCLIWPNWRSIAARSVGSWVETWRSSSPTFSWTSVLIWPLDASPGMQSPEMRSMLPAIPASRVYANAPSPSVIATLTLNPTMIRFPIVSFI
jgi:hypothetical protein